MTPQQARSEEAPAPADASQPAPVLDGAPDAIPGQEPAADPVLDTLAGLLQRTRAARRASMDFPPVRRQSGAFRASSSEGLRSVSTLSTAGDCGGGPSLAGSRASADGAASGSDLTAAGHAGSRASSPPPADWDACSPGVSLTNSTADAAVGGGHGVVAGPLLGVESVEGSIHSGRSWTDASWSQVGAADGSHSQSSSSVGTEATATMLPQSRALAALFLRTKQQGVLTTTRPSQRLQAPETQPQVPPDDSRSPLGRPKRAPFKVEAAEADDFHGGWAGRLASACIDKAASGLASASSAGTLARRASASRSGEELSRTGSPAAAAPSVDAALAASAAIQPDGLDRHVSITSTRPQASGAGVEAEPVKAHEGPATVMQVMLGSSNGKLVVQLLLSITLHLVERLVVCHLRIVSLTQSVHHASRQPCASCALRADISWVSSEARATKMQLEGFLKMCSAMRRRCPSLGPWIRCWSSIVARGRVSWKPT